MQYAHLFAVLSALAMHATAAPVVAAGVAGPAGLEVRDGQGPSSAIHDSGIDARAVDDLPDRRNGQDPSKYNHIGARSSEHGSAVHEAQKRQETPASVIPSQTSAASVNPSPQPPSSADPSGGAGEPTPTVTPPVPSPTDASGAPARKFDDQGRPISPPADPAPTSAGATPPPPQVPNGAPSAPGGPNGPVAAQWDSQGRPISLPANPGPASAGATPPPPQASGGAPGAPGDPQASAAPKWDDKGQPANIGEHIDSFKAALGGVSGVPPFEAGGAGGAGGRGGPDIASIVGKLSPATLEDLDKTVPGWRTALQTVHGGPRTPAPAKRRMEGRGDKPDSAPPGPETEPKFGTEEWMEKFKNTPKGLGDLQAGRD